MQSRMTWVALAGLLAVALGVWVALGDDEAGDDLASDGPAARSDRSALAPTGAPVPSKPDSRLPHTALPLRLVATVVREDPGLSLATLEDLERTTHQVLAGGQALRDHPAVTLVRIERRRLVLDNGGVREQLVLDPSARVPEATDLSEGVPSPEPRADRRELSARLRAITDAGSDSPDGGERGGILREGEVSAVYEEGELVGVRLVDVREDGVYDRIGLRSGDLVTSINGVRVGDPTAVADVLTEIAVADMLEVEVERIDGQEGILSVPTGELTHLLQDLE